MNVWFKYPNITCGRAVRMFLDDYKDRMDKDDFYALNRVPNIFIKTLDLRFWINRTMNPIWEKLIAIQEEDVFERVDILKLLKRWDKCCKAVNNSCPADNELRVQKRRTKQNDHSNRIKKRAVDELYGSHRASNQWNVCK